MNTIADLYTEVARVLAGKDVILQFKRPVYKNLLGCASKNESGKLVIDLTPDLPGELSLKVFLHELAHIKLHARKYASSRIGSMASGSVKSGGDPDEKQEREADEFASHWLSYARLHLLDHYKNSMSEEEAMLQALLHYYDKKR